MKIPGSSGNFKHKETLYRQTNNTNNTSYDQKETKEDDLRSVRTEYDYKKKKNFIDILG